MFVKRFLLLILISTFLIACSGGTKEQLSTDELKALVHEYSIGEFTDETASITANELIIVDADGKETIYELPDDEFFVSIAPYVNETHPWMNHSLTGCQGELIKETFDVYIEDEAGNTIIDEKIETMKNGFFDLWLPRDEVFNIVIEKDGKKAAQQLSTYEDDGTCITTMALE